MQASVKDLEKTLNDWGTYSEYYESLPWVSPSSRYEEIKNLIENFGQERVEMTLTESSAIAMRNYANAHPLEARIDKFINSDLTRDQHIVIVLRYKAKLNNVQISKVVNNLSYKQVRNRLLKAKDRIRSVL